MKKTEFVKKMMQTTKMTNKEVNAVYGAFWKNVFDELQKGGEVRLTGIGTFRLKKRKAREGVNPQTGKKIVVPEKKVLTFVPSHSVTDMFNGAR